MRPPPLEETGSRLDHPEEALAFTAPAGFVRPRDSRARQTPWSVFQDGSGGSPTLSPLTRSNSRGAPARQNEGGRRTRHKPVPTGRNPRPGTGRPETERGNTMFLPRPPSPDPIRGEAVKPHRRRSELHGHLPHRAHGRPGVGRGTRPTRSAPGEGRKDRRDGHQGSARARPHPTRPGLNLAGRLCGSARLPLGGFTYS